MTTAKSKFHSSNFFKYIIFYIKTKQKSTAVMAGRVPCLLAGSPLQHRHTFPGDPPNSVVLMGKNTLIRRERLQRLDQALGARLEAEGRELCRVVTEHILTCF